MLAAVVRSPVLTAHIDVKYERDCALAVTMVQVFSDHFDTQGTRKSDFWVFQEDTIKVLNALDSPFC